MKKFFSIQDFEPKDVDIKFSFKTLNIDNDISIETCILKVRGDYPYGSQGAPIGEYLRGLSVFLIEIFSLDALIIDLSLLNYSWGDNLLKVAQPKMLQTSNFVGDTWLGYYVVGSKTNKDALHGLFCEFGASSGIKKIYLSIDEAMADITKKGKQIYKDE